MTKVFRENDSVPLDHAAARTMTSDAASALLEVARAKAAAAKIDPGSDRSAQNADLARRTWKR